MRIFVTRRIKREGYTLKTGILRLIINEVFLTCQCLLPLLCLLVGVLPGLLELVDVTLKELWAVWVLHQLLSLGHEVCDHPPFVVQGVEHLVLLLYMLLSLQVE